MRIRSLTCLVMVLAAAPPVRTAEALMPCLSRSARVDGDDRLAFAGPALPPAALVDFCQLYRSDCLMPQYDDRSTRLPLTPSLRHILGSVNDAVNTSILPKDIPETSGTSRWIVAPARGSCHDFAVTKRHRLIERGVPARHLLLAEVVTSWNEHHLVLVVQTTKGDLVLDNLQAQIQPLRASGYRWVRAQTPENPYMWSRVANARQTAGASEP